MKILAVIPARAGSKGIPNKNIRLLNGRPLISYVIETAQKSKYITDIIISTDSKEVEIIGKQMGIFVKQRSAELCQDQVTLDAVIYDAVKNTDCDYVVTMQPTSPTLSSASLDKAIAYCIANQLDTLISAINRPHLSWREENGRKIPNYTERLNRQFLPANFMETGAFLISRYACVTEQTRIGTNVDVFELPEEEAVDIDNFEDLLYAEHILRRMKVAIYVNGNNKRGIGHIYRALEIADEFFTKPDIYYDVNQTDPTVFGSTTHTLIPVNGIAELFECCREKSYTLFINDILTTSIDYMIGLRSVLPHAHIVNFEDDGEGILKADLVFNALYKENDLPQVYSGEKYYIAGKTFLFYQPIKIKEHVENIFIAFGGADPQNYTDRLLSMISKDTYSSYHFTVVLGRAKTNIENLMKYNHYPNINVLYDVSNMPELMSECDIAITSRGRTGYELALLGIPSIAMAQNQREEKHGFVCNENRFTYIGLNPEDEIIEGNLKMYLSLSAESRKHFQEKLLRHDLRGGRHRVMHLITKLL